MNEQSGEYKEYRERVVNDALSKTKFRPKPPTPEEEVIQRAMDVTIKIRQHIRPILEAGGWFKDPEAMKALIHTLYLQAFTEGFDREELAIICTVLHAPIMIETIEASPYGVDKPDKLGGV
jgi:hypothetical protein